VHTHRVRLFLFLLAAIAVLVAMYVLYSASATLQQLDIIEAERDTWQRPSDVIAELNLHAGSVVADVGSGSGYFALKLAPIAGRSGKVLAVDLRRLSLSFLWIRAAIRGLHNVRVISGDLDDPHLAPESVDAVLIANTYHEFGNPEQMVEHLFRTLRTGGRMVILDRGGPIEQISAQEHAHGIEIESVRHNLEKHGFRTITQADAFIDRATEGRWWLLVANK
jgi:ubiquinone/menaquinone biosynthesis C-methylase UbiE